ncbi:MAG: AI-2E family transporter, partial [Planctomycetota bacterium]
MKPEDAELEAGHHAEAPEAARQSDDNDPPTKLPAGSTDSVDIDVSPMTPTAITSAVDDRSAAAALRDRLAVPEVAAPGVTDARLATIQRAAVVLMTLAIIFMLWVGKPLLLPLVIAALLSFLLSPICEKLEHWKVPRAMATATVVTLAGFVVGGLFFAVYSGLDTVVGDERQIDQIKEELQTKVRRLPLSEGVGGRLEKAADAAGGVIDA